MGIGLSHRISFSSPILPRGDQAYLFVTGSF